MDDLYGAVALGNAEKVKDSLLLKYVHPDGYWTEKNGKLAPIHIALDARNLEIIEYLLECGANVNAQSPDGSSPLHIACSKGEKDIVDVLLKCGANVNAQSPDGSSPLHIACSKGEKDIVDVLLKYGANVNAQLPDGSSPLHKACSKGEKDIVDVLLKHGADGSLKDAKLKTPLSIAVRSGNEDITHALLEAWTKVDLPTNVLSRAKSKKFFIILELIKVYRFLQAVIKGHFQLVKGYIEGGGIDIDAETLQGCTALYYATLRGDMPMIEYLLRNGADPDKCPKNGRSPLYYAAKRGNHKLVKLLMKANLNFTYAKNNASVLFVACKQGNCNIVDSLLKAGANPEIPRKDDSTPLSIACRNGHLSVVKSLLHSNVRTWFPGQTMPALHVALRQDHIRIATELLKAGADISTKDKFGKTALQLALGKGQLPVIQEMFEKCGAIRYWLCNQVIDKETAEMYGQQKCTSYLAKVPNELINMESGIEYPLILAPCINCSGIMLLPTEATETVCLFQSLLENRSFNAQASPPHERSGHILKLYTRNFQYFSRESELPNGSIFPPGLVSLVAANTLSDTDSQSSGSTDDSNSSESDSSSEPCMENTQSVARFSSTMGCCEDQPYSFWDLLKMQMMWIILSVRGSLWPSWLNYSDCSFVKTLNLIATVKECNMQLFLIETVNSEQYPIYCGMYHNNNHGRCCFIYIRKERTLYLKDLQWNIKWAKGKVRLQNPWENMLDFIESIIIHFQALAFVTLDEDLTNYLPACVLTDEICEKLFSQSCLGEGYNPTQTVESEKITACITYVLDGMIKNKCSTCVWLDAPTNHMNPLTIRQLMQTITRKCNEHHLQIMMHTNSKDAVDYSRKYVLKTVDIF